MSEKKLENILKEFGNLQVDSVNGIKLLEEIKAKVDGFERTNFLPFNLSIDKRKIKVKKDFKEKTIDYTAGKKDSHLLPFMEEYYKEVDESTYSPAELSHLAKYSIGKLKEDENKSKKLLKPIDENHFFVGNSEKFKGCGFCNNLFLGTDLPDQNLVNDKNNKLVLEEKEDNVWGKSFRRVTTTNQKSKYQNPLDHIYLFERFWYTYQSYSRFYPVGLETLSGRKKEKKEIIVLLEKAKTTLLEDYSDCERENHLVSTFKDRMRGLFKLLNHDQDWEDSFQDAGHVVAVSSSAQDTISFTNSEMENIRESFNSLCERDHVSSAGEKEKKKYEEAKKLQEMKKEGKEKFLPELKLPATPYLCFLNGILQDSQVNQIYYRNIEKLIQKIRFKTDVCKKCKVLVKHDQFYEDDLKKYFPYLTWMNWTSDLEGLVTKMIPLFFVVSVASVKKINSRKLNELYLFFVPNNVKKLLVDKTCRETAKERTYYPNDSFKKYSILKNPKSDVEIFTWVLDRIHRFGCARLPTK